ncbi:chromosome condensation regulator related protein [Cyclospora cayetanensis]|uniref:Chromosome condensation regulator related protein n=1 Tax=Cyclospora cayetanensis TaxID=88456 RepID=A0A1D3CT23_9EIME|nr:chromosome condensation regulator related protein [Cyclospora cayetanensis]
MEEPSACGDRPVGTTEASDAMALIANDLLSASDANEDTPSMLTASEEVWGTMKSAEAPECRESSDLLTHTLQKVGIPPAPLKNESHNDRDSCSEELIKSQVTGAFASADAHLCAPKLADAEFPATPHAASNLEEARKGEKEERSASEDTAVPSLESEPGQGSSSLLPEGVYAVGEGTLVEDNFAFNEDDMHAIATAFQTTSDITAVDLTADKEKTRERAASSGAAVPPQSTPSARLTELCTKAQGADRHKNKAPLGEASGDTSYWPFESGLRPWEDIGQEARETAEGVNGHQLEDYRKIQDVKTSVLCACDVMADEGEDSESSKAGAGFCLRQIRPLPDSAEVDGDDLFRGVKTLTLRSDLPPPAEEAEGNSRQGSESNGPLDGSSKGEKGSSEVRVRVVLGPRMFSKDFPSLTDGATYLLEPYSTEAEDAQQRAELSNLRKLTGDKWRRISVAIEPMRTNLLKHTRFGHPHLRQFQLSTDHQRLLWYSASKGKDASMVHMGDLEGLVLGQKSVTFGGYRIPTLSHLSFSLVFRDGEPSRAYAETLLLPDATLEEARTLDLTCKDEFEFDAWVTGCKAIIAANKGLKLSKMHLLSHSRRFLYVLPLGVWKAMQRSQTTVQLTKLPEVKESAGLQDCMDLPWHPPEELERKYEEQKKRLDAAAEEMRGLDRKAIVRSNVDLSVFVGAGPAYATILGDCAEVDDEDMEFERMLELVKEVTQVLTQAKTELREYREAESTRLQQERVEASACMECTVLNPPGNSEAPSPASEESPRGTDQEGRLSPSLEGLDSSSILAISSGGQVLTRSGSPGLTFEERFKMASGSSVDLDAVQEQLKEGLSTLLQHAASQTAEAQQLLSSALAAAASAVGVEAKSETEPPPTLPEEDVVKLKSINQLLWRAEVDVENIEDMLARLQASSGFGGLALAGTVANLNQMVTEQVNKWGGQIASMVTDLLRRAEVPQLVSPTGLHQWPSVAYSDSEYEDDLS